MSETELTKELDGTFSYPLPQPATPAPQPEQFDAVTESLKDYVLPSQLLEAAETLQQLAANPDVVEALANQGLEIDREAVDSFAAVAEIKPQEGTVAGENLVRKAVNIVLLHGGGSVI